MRPGAQNALLLVSFTLLSVGLAECGLRLHHTGGIARLHGEHSLRIAHPTRGWALAPDGRAHQRNRDFAILVLTNSQGLRDRPHDYAKPDGTFRIVVLGDSFMEAYQVELEETLPFRLQETLASRNVEVINLGVGGYGTAQEFLALREEGLRYSPDLVVLAFFAANDVLDNSRALQVLLLGEDEPRVYGRPYATASGLDTELGWIPPDFERARRREEKKQRSREGLRAIAGFVQPVMVASVLEQAAGSLLARFEGRSASDPNLELGAPFLEEFAPELGHSGLSATDYARLWEEAWLVTRRLLLETKSLAAENGSELLVMVVPAFFQVEPRHFEAMRREYPELRIDAMRINRALRDFCAAHAIEFFDPTDGFAAADARGEGPLFHQLEDHHWNGAGHARAADELARTLVERGLVPVSGRRAR
jgi:lysophospholipase L1-like esterase